MPKPLHREIVLDLTESRRARKEAAREGREVLGLGELPTRRERERMRLGALERRAQRADLRIGLWGAVDRGVLVAAVLSVSVFLLFLSGC